MSLRTNLNPNPTCSVSGANYYGSSGSGRVSGLSGFSNRTTGFRFASTGSGTHPQSGTLVRNTQYTFSADLRLEYSGNVTLNVDVYVDGSYNLTRSGSPQSVSNGVVSRKSVTFTTPNVSGTIRALLNLVDRSGAIVSSAVLYELGSVSQSYFDGNTATASWTGTPGLSTSTIETAASSPVSVFPITADLAVDGVQASVTRVSSSPFPDTAPVGFAAQDATVRIIGEGPPLDLPPPSPEPVWTIYVRNLALGREAQVDDFEALTCICRFNDVGTWELRLDRRSPAADALATRGAGIEIRRDDYVMMTGPVTRLKRDRSDRSNLLIASGVDDNIWLERRLAHPQPGSSAPPYSTVDNDVREGVGSTIIWQYVNVNLGPGAISPRQLPTLTMAADPAVGASVKGTARYDVLLELIQKLAIAAGDIGFKIAQQDLGLVFTVYAPEDKSSSITFSEGFANLSSFSYESIAPAYTYVYGGGEGEGKARVIVEGQDPAAIAQWGRIEKLVDAREQEDGPSVSQQISTALAENTEKLSLDITPVETTGLRYGEHYQLGDKVSAVIDGVLIADIVREVEVRLVPNAAAQLTPVLGTPGRNTLLALFEQVRDLNSRTRNLERR